MKHLNLCLAQLALICATLLALTSPAVALNAASRIDRSLTLNSICELSAFVSNVSGGLASVRIDGLGFNPPTQLQTAGGTGFINGGISTTFPAITVGNLEANCGLADVANLVQQGAAATYATHDLMLLSFDATQTSTGDRYAYLAEINGVVATTVTVGKTLLNAAPTVTLGSLSGPDGSGNYTVIATLSESSTDFSSSSLTLTNATATVSGSGDSYTIVLTPIADGPVSVSIQRGAFTDNEGLGNWDASNEVGFEVDITAPTVDIAAPTTSLNGPGSFDVTVMFSEVVTGFDASDVAVTNGSVTNVTGSGADYVATIAATGGGDVDVSIPAGAAADAAGNTSAASDTLSISNAIVEETQKIIAQFMQTRANLLIASQPSLTGFLSGENTEGSFSAKATNEGGIFDFVSSPNDSNNLWMRLNGTWANEDTRESQYMFGVIGSHYTVTPNLLLGGMVEFDYLSQNDGAAHIEGSGWLAGPYFVARVADHPLFIDGRVLYGQTTNEVSPLGTYTDSFDTERFLAQIKVSGELKYSATTVMPSLQLSYTTDDQKAYTDSLDNLIPAQGVALGQVEIGVDFLHDITFANSNALLELTGGISAIGSYTSGTGNAELIIPEYEGGRAKLKLGANYIMESGGTLALDTFYDGIGTHGYESYGLQVGFNLAF